jgi:hypothetical protein
MTIDVVFLAFNRLEFTEFSFTKMVKNTNWSQVTNLVIYDDGSKDGTKEWLVERAQSMKAKIPTVIHHTRFGSPVAVMNHWLDNHDSDSFAKIDNDIVVPDKWLPEMLRLTHLNPSLQILGMQPNIGPPVPGRTAERVAEECRWIGGVGIIRRSAFLCCRPSPRGRFGWTEWQTYHPTISRAWIRPDLTIFELDRVPLEPWKSLSKKYVEKGWQREWGPYPDDMSAYWDWALS